MEGRNRVNLADTIVQSLHGSQSVRYATVVGSTGTGAQVSIGGDTIEVAYVGDTPPEVGKRAVLVSSNGSLLCIGTTTTQEPEWSEPQQMLVRPQGDWLATTGYPWEEEQWGSSGFGAGVANPTSGIWAGTVHKTDFTSGTYLGEYLGEGEVEFAVQYPDLGDVLPPEAELLGVSLRLYSTYRYTTVQRLGEYLFYKTPNVARPVDVTIEVGDIPLSTSLPARDVSFDRDGDYDPLAAGTLIVQQGITVELPGEWVEGMGSGDVRTLVFSATGGLWRCANVRRRPVPLPVSPGYRADIITSDNLNLIVTYRTPVADGEE